MCGNFGLLRLGESQNPSSPEANENDFRRPSKAPDDLDMSLSASMHEVSRLGGLRMTVDDISSVHGDAKKEVAVTKDSPKKQVELLPPLTVLQSQTACTEIRGGQAGGYSTLEYLPTKGSAGAPAHQLQHQTLDHQEGSSTSFPISDTSPPKSMRVRMVARKRHPLAADLAALYLARGGKVPDESSTVTIIGHTRFATSSANIESELHPHEWVPFHEEYVWMFDAVHGTFNRSVHVVGLHLSHNGDFDAMEAYSQTMVVEEVGLWLERILHVPNNTRGDSPKVCGTLDLFRVQGRWAAAARLAWVRVALKASTDVSGGEQLSKSAPNMFPGPSFWADWAIFIEEVFAMHINNIVKVVPPSQKDPRQLHRYYIDKGGEKQFIDSLERLLSATSSSPSAAGAAAVAAQLGVSDWPAKQLHAFLHHTVRGFFHGDLYTAMTEFLSRAEGSFGLQVHSTLEPGVVIIASKGQPMSLAFDPVRPLCLFGSEAEAVAVPIDKEGKWLPERIDLDSHGEIMRIGEPKALLQGTFSSGRSLLAAIATTATATAMWGGHGGANSTSNNMTTDAAAAKNHHHSTTGTATAGGAAASANASASATDPSSVEMGALMIAEKLKASKVYNLRNAIITSVHGSIHGSRHGVVGGFSLHGGGGTRSSHGQRLRPAPGMVAFHLSKSNSLHRVLLQSGIEIRSYSLVSRSESRADDILDRCISVVAAPVPYDPRVDLVKDDLKVVPAVLSAIDKAWAAPQSIERITGHSLADCLVNCMLRRMDKNLDTIDLLIGGVEVSLWMAEQWAADLRSIFPQLNVTTVSANKLLGLGNESAGKVYFSGADDVLTRRIDSYTCALLISQSGQTFPTLHATRKVAKLVKNRLWLLTGCFNSKMEQAMVESYREHGLRYGRNRVFNNYSGNRPAEPSSVAVAATWHTLTRLMMLIIHVVRSKCPGGRLVHPWDYDGNANKIQHWARGILWRICDKNHRRQAEQAHSTTTGALKPSSAATTREIVHDGHTVSFTGKSKARNDIVMLLSDGCIEDMESLLTTTVVTNLCVIVGHDLKGRPITPSSQQQQQQQQSACCHHPVEAVLRLIRRVFVMHIDTVDYTSLTPATGSVHAELVSSGRAWADHVNEPWRMLFFAGGYIILSVGLGLPIFGLLADAVVAIIRACGGDLGAGRIGFTSRAPFGMLHGQGAGWWLVGLAIQFADALLYVFFVKIITWVDRFIWARPFWARFGKRTIVIVDTPCVHQLLEIFVSKLYSQGYSFCSVDVHGASGMDHFVHRFTHRVVRGLLLAVGRPDGRLCCLAKSEAAVFLAAKQAAFIRNPDFPGPSGGPEFVTIGHNPFQPNVGLAHHVQLRGGGPGGMSRRKFVDEYLYERLFMATKPFTKAILRALALSHDHAIENGLIGRPSTAALRNNNVAGVVLSGSSHASTNIFTTVAHHDDGGNDAPSTASSGLMTTTGFSRHGCASVHGYLPRNASFKSGVLDGEPLPYGAHHIDPSQLFTTPAHAKANRGNMAAETSTVVADSMFAEFVLNSKGLLNAKTLANVSKEVEKSNDPAVRLAFASRLDSETRAIQDRQELVQHFYETRIASLERYIAFCVMFHAMAEASHAPWLQFPWDIARSQSNLRVATTAAPISASGDDHGSAAASPETKKCARKLVECLQGFAAGF